MVHSSRYRIFVFILIGLISVSIFGYGIFIIRTLYQQNNLLANELEMVRETLIEKENRIIEFDASVQKLKQEFALSEENGLELLTLLTDEKERNEAFEKQIHRLSGTVGKLDKLSKTDPELLQKYSKIYFLNEHYVPSDLSKIRTEYLFKPEEQEYIHEKVSPFLHTLLEDAKDDGISLRVLSGYRSYNEQEGLKGAYTVQYGSGANTFSADQGYSEHQLGTTVDLTALGTTGSLSGFENTEAYTWLQKHAYRYGFILSYPEDNGYYIFEPWHWRFVGEDLADDLHDDQVHFYNLEQRSLDTYLISIFD